MYKPCTHLDQKNRRTVNVYESSLKEKRGEIAYLNQEEKRLDDLPTNNNGNKNLWWLAQSDSLENEISEKDKSFVSINVCKTRVKV
jgi:hypothetical protein